MLLAIRSTLMFVKKAICSFMYIIIMSMCVCMDKNVTFHLGSNSIHNEFAVAFHNRDRGIGFCLRGQVLVLQTGVELQMS